MESIAERIVRKIESFDAQDDVFCADFLTDTLILRSPPIADPDLHDLKSKLEGISILGLKSWKLKSLLLLPPFSDSESLPCGPYFLRQSEIFEAWKLYEDRLSAFQTGVIADHRTPYRYVDMIQLGSAPA